MDPNLPRTGDSRVEAGKIREALTGTMRFIRDEINSVDDPRAEALFETSAEVLQGLITSYTHFEERSEQAWE